MPPPWVAKPSAQPIDGHCRTVLHQLTAPPVNGCLKLSFSNSRDLDGCRGLLLRPNRAFGAFADCIKHSLGCYSFFRDQRCRRLSYLLHILSRGSNALIASKSHARENCSSV